MRVIFQLGQMRRVTLDVLAKVALDVPAAHVAAVAAGSLRDIAAKRLFLSVHLLIPRLYLPHSLFVLRLDLLPRHSLEATLALDYPIFATRDILRCVQLESCLIE